MLAVSVIPAGRVATYGDIGRVAGVGPRQVGAVLRDHDEREQGASVPWWRVLSASGTSPVLDAARPFWDAEGITVDASGRGCRLRAYRADPHQLAADYAAALTAGAAGPDGRGVTLS
nr:MGMT family protein [Propioniciclava soli]